MIMRKILLALCFIGSLATYSQTVRVAAAGNLRYIMEDIKAEYIKKSPKAKINVVYGSSGSLTQQIINGAAYDFFMSADIKYPQKLKEQGCASGAVKIYGYGKLVLWSNSIDLSQGIESLNDPKITHIAIAKPDIAPYGERAVQCMKYYKIYDKLKGKLVYADNIAQAAQFAESGNAEAAFIAYALVFGPEMQKKGKYYLLDEKSYKPVEQACVLLKGWERNPEASKFMNFVLSAECKPIFKKYGFILPN
jgi:molybdate transport system substrate-binding protein